MGFNSGFKGLRNVGVLSEPNQFGSFQFGAFLFGSARLGSARLASQPSVKEAS